MSLITTAPARIAKLLMDASTDVVSAEHLFLKSLDSIDRPGWVITDNGGDHSTAGSPQGTDNFTESYRLELLGKQFGMGLENEHEIETRQIVSDTVAYFLKHPQLQCSNTRGLLPNQLRALNYVRWFNLRRESITLYGSDEAAHWGCVMTLTISGSFGYAIAVY